MTTQYESLKGAVAVVTGGASGIGAALVEAFCEQGSRVCCLDLDREAGTALEGALNRRHGAGSVLFLPCDLTDIAALQAALVRSHELLGPASVLVNNAANDRREEFLGVEPEQFDFMMAVNLRHVYFASQAIVPQMQQLGGGAIINMSSGAWVAGNSDATAYATAKAAIVGLTNSLARRLGGDRIRVNALAPGAVRTERQMRLWHSEDSMQAIIAQQCIHETLLPEHVAKTVMFLASEDAAMISKQLIFVNGGLR